MKSNLLRRQRLIIPKLWNTIYILSTMICVVKWLHSTRIQAKLTLTLLNLMCSFWIYLSSVLIRPRKLSGLTFICSYENVLNLGGVVQWRLSWRTYKIIFSTLTWNSLSCWSFNLLSNLFQVLCELVTLQDFLILIVFWTCGVFLNRNLRFCSWRFQVSLLWKILVSLLKARLRCHNIRLISTRYLIRIQIIFEETYRERLFIALKSFNLVTKIAR